MHKLILALLFLCCFAFLSADEVDDKLKELRQLEKKLESAQQKAKQTETKKAQTKAELNKTATMKRQTEEELKKLSATEAVVKDSISAVNRRLENVQSNLSVLDTQNQKAIKAIMQSGLSKDDTAKAGLDRYYLKQSVRNIRRHQDVLSGYRIMLVHDYEQHRSVYGRVSKNLRNERSKSITYDRKIKNLSAEDSKLSKESSELQAQINKLRADAAALETLIARLTAASGKESASYRFSGKKIPWPVKGKVIRNFGEETKSYGTSVVNNGIDIAVPEGTNVSSIDDGEVVFADRYGGQGRLVIIDHKNGFFSVYAYNSELLVKKGDKVKRGQSVAKSGMSGSATQPSLRFELRKDGSAVNPMNYLE